MTVEAPEATRERLVDWDAVLDRKPQLHPMQVELLRRAATEEVSPKDWAAEHEVPLANVAYHVVQLHKAKLLICVRRVPRRGAVQHFYRLAEVARVREA
jgi:hypothetical protein